MWVCVDGTEGVGKTTVTAKLLEAVPSSVGINEFSDTPFGEALRTAVRSHPHFISTSPVGQSLVFLGDFMELYESKVRPALSHGQIVITDRGWLSKYTYQSAVLQRVMDREQAAALLEAVMAYIPKPDLTVLLTVPSPVIRARLVERDRHCSDERLAFIERAAAEARDFAARAEQLSVEVVDGDRPREVVLGEALAALKARQST
jgi:dTMP kinase